MPSHSLSPEVSRDAALLVAGRFVTMLGTGMAPICLVAGGLASRRIGAGGLGFIVGSLVLGELMFTVLGGVFADHAGARSSMICGDLLAFCAQASIALLFVTGRASIVTIAGMASLLGIGAALSNPASSALVKQICSDSRLAGVNGWIRTAGVSARVLGAPIGGFIAVGSRPSTGLFIDAATFLCSAGMLSLVAAKRQVRHAKWRPTSPITDIRTGWRNFRDIKWLMPAALAASVVNAARTVGNVLVPAVLALTGYGPEVWGMIFGLQMVGNVLALWTVAKRKSRHALPLSFIGVILVGVYYTAVAIRMPLPLIGIFALLAGGSISNFGMRFELTMQRTVPDAVMSRVVAVASMFSLALAPIATGTLALIVSAAGSRAALALWGLAAVAAILSAAFSRSVIGSQEPVSANQALPRHDGLDKVDQIDNART